MSFVYDIIFWGVFMNILHICDYAAAYRGNFIESLEVLNQKLKETGGKIVYAFPQRIKNREDHWYEKLSEHSPVYIYGDKPANKIKVFQKIIREQKIDIVHTHFTNNETDLCAKIACKSKKIIKIKNYESRYGVSGTKKRIAAKLIYKNWHAIAVSKSVDEEISKFNPFLSHRYINNAVYFKRLDTSSPIDKSSVFSDKSSINCFMLAYDYYLKGADIALKAISELRENLNICLMISVPSNLDKIKEQITKQFGKIPNWVKLVPPRNDIAAYYNISDVFLSPSRREGFCYAIVEAAYCKNIVIASDCDGQLCHAQKNLDILWFKNEDSESLKESIREAISLINNNELKEKNKALAAKNYNIDSWASSVVKAYEYFEYNF